jgi:hypothetical protein
MEQRAKILLLAWLLAATSSARARSVEPEKSETISQRTVGLERHDGYFPYYWDSRRGVLLLEVSRWNDDFLYGAGLASGAGVIDAFLDRGALGGLGLCRFERVGPKALLVQKQTTNRSGVADPERTRAVEESFPTSILASMPVVAEEGSRVLVDATEFLLKDTQVLPLLRQAKQGDWRQDVSRSALNFSRTGAFPRNSEFEVDLSFVSENPGASFAEVVPDGSTMSLRIHHSFVELPDPGYTARSLDPRIGFFATFYRDQTAPFSEPIERYLVNRWRVDEAHPIVYYLDRGIPEPERTAIREAALWWNHAFEEAGLRNAFVVKDLPPGATFLDIRYSGIEWINRTERGWSVGEVQADPRTGEILHGVARIDSHRRRTTSRIWQNLRLPGRNAACSAGESPDFSWLAGDDPNLDESSLVLERLRYLAAHEVGHTLGLQHNWAATTFGWGSVMDYLAPNIQIREGKLDLSDAYPADIGSYDRLMIKWGYSRTEDRSVLESIVRDGYGRGLVFPLESDPRWAEYDWGADPVKWLKTAQEVRRVILDRFGAAQLKPGEPVYDLQARFSLAYLYHRFGIQAAQQFVGGQFQTNALAGDGQKPVAWVPPGQQKDALRLLLEALKPENLEIPDPILSVLVAPPQSFLPTRERFPSEARDTFSALTAARSLSELIVVPLLSPDRVARLTLDREPGALTPANLLDQMVSSTWGRPAEDSSKLAELSRVSQRVVLDAMMDLAANPNSSPEVRASVIVRLIVLRKDLEQPLSGDAASRAHVLLSRRDLADFLNKPEVRKMRTSKFAAPPGRPIGDR